MGKLFWIGSGVGFLAAIGLWGGMTRSIQGKVKGLHDDLTTKRGELTEWSTSGPGDKQKFDKIVNQRFIDVERAYKKELSEMTGVLLKQMRARNMSIDPAIWESAPPPMNEPSQFRQWLTTKYDDRNSAMMQKGVVVPDDSISLGDVPDWDDVQKKDLPTILLYYRISCEVFTALAEASANVRYVAKVKDEEGEMQSYDHEAVKKIISLESLRFEDQVGRSGRSGRPRRPRPGAAGKKSSLFKEYTFIVKFDAHLGAALDFIRRLEGSKTGIFVIRTVDIIRIDRLPESQDGENAYVNKIKAEAPVTVEMTASLIEFVGDKGGER